MELFQGIVDSDERIQEFKDKEQVFIDTKKLLEDELANYKKISEMQKSKIET